MDAVYRVQGESGDQEIMALYKYFKCVKNKCFECPLPDPEGPLFQIHLLMQPIMSLFY